MMGTTDMSIERVNYFDRQYLRLEDFTDEQGYQIAMRRRHNISHHTWGIVEGLEPTIVDGSPYVSPGLAIDGFGRELILKMLQPLPPQAFVNFNTDELQVWMDYATTLTSAPLKGYADCGANGTRQYYRVSEKPVVRFAKPDVNSTPRKPSSVLLTDSSFDATQTSPEDRNWPIFLGTVKYNAANTQQPYSIDLSKRPYAGLVGESVIDPAGSTKLQIGAEDLSDPNRFAVFIPASDTDPGVARLAIQKDGTVKVRGQTTMSGNVTVSGGTIQVGVGPDTSPQPWRIYRVQETDATATEHNELRIEMEGGGSGNNQVVIGAWSAQDSKFKPCLTVADTGTVTVAGNLVIMGKLDVNPDNMVPGTLTTEAKAFVASAAMAGFAAGHAQVNPDILMQTPGLAPPAAVAAATAGTQIKEVASLIAHPDEKHLRELAGMLKTDYREIAAKLKRLLD
jgi:hypothetical protein